LNTSIARDIEGVLYADKEVSNNNREERRHREKEEQIKNYYDLQKIRGSLELMRPMHGQDPRR
jgi:hypothetical protein